MPITSNLLLAAVFFIIAAACIVPMQGLKGGNSSVIAVAVFVVSALATLVFSFLYLASLFIPK